MEQRRARGDLIQTFKILKGIDKINAELFFDLNTTFRTRGHKYKLNKKRPKLEMRKHFFSQRVVNLWNQLPQHVVEADSVNNFKNRLDKFNLRK